MSAEARRLGLVPGQKVTDARALVPELVIAEAEPDADALAALADWCVRFSPAVALAPPDGLFLDITGLSHLWAGRAAPSRETQPEGPEGDAGPASSRPLSRLRRQLPQEGEHPIEPNPAHVIAKGTRGAPSRMARAVPEGSSPSWGRWPGGPEGDAGRASSRPLSRLRRQLPQEGEHPLRAGEGASTEGPPDGEAVLLEDLRGRLAGNGIGCRLAIADTPGAAWALAHYGPDGAIAPPGGQGPLLAPLPPEALRLPAEDARQIVRLGLTRLGQLMELPRGPLAHRFGAATVARLDQALGRASEALTFRRPPSPWFARLAFAEPISAPEDLARASRDIADRLCARLEREGQGGRRFALTFHRADGAALSLTIGLALAGRDPARIARLFQPRLETLDPGFGFEVVTLEADGVEATSARQIRLDSQGEAAAEDGLVPLIDRLTNRLGEGRVFRSAPQESHVPELSARPAPALERPSTTAWDPERPRPLRLFRRPEPVEQVMAVVPDDPPLQFRWRGRLHRVRRAEGPERIGEEWWRGPIEAADTHHVRDYYRVEDETGARFWLFRAGLYRPDVPAQWWLHGVFG